MYSRFNVKRITFPLPEMRSHKQHESLKKRSNRLLKKRTDKMAERSKALRSGRSPLLWAWISESKFFHYAVTVSISLLKYCSAFCSA
ncbi:hypothetical protein T08_10481 [Trichinella sp. T8]|nr:hypothetical protein T08_10481 [Trichinella sp. T8]